MLNLSESLLARLTDPTRAAAIYGDLVELAATRGRLWFWLAYARTLVTLVWRTSAAFLSGCAALAFAMFAAGHWMRYVPHQEHTLTMVPQFIALMGPFARIFLVGMAMPLWFLVPFGLVRYGARDRFVRLAFVFALLGTAAFLNLAVVVLTNAATVILLILCALFSSKWRKPMVVIAATAATGLAAAVVFSDAFSKIYHPYVADPYEPHLVASIIPKLVILIAMAVPAVVCSWMHDRILPSDFTDGQHA